MGRTPKPSAIKKAQGTSRPEREKDYRTVWTSKPKLKYPLFIKSARAKKLYKDHFNTLNDWELLSDADLYNLGMMVKYMERFEQLDKLIIKQGFTVFDDKGIERLNPLVREQKNCVSTILELSKSFGMTPVDRERLKLSVMFGDGATDDGGEFGDI